MSFHRYLNLLLLPTFVTNSISFNACHYRWPHTCSSIYSPLYHSILSELKQHWWNSIQRVVILTIKNIIKHKFTCVQFQIQQKKGKTDPGVDVIQSQKNTNTETLDIQVPVLILNQCTFLGFCANSSFSPTKSFPKSNILNGWILTEIQGKMLFIFFTHYLYQAECVIQQIVCVV